MPPSAICTTSRTVAVSERLLPELQRRVDLLRAHLHPLAAHLDQRRFHVRQRLAVPPSVMRLVAEGDLPVELDDIVRATGRCRRQPGLHAGARGQARLGALARPPRRQQHAEAGLFERGGLAAEELVRARGIGRVAFRRGAFQALVHRGVDAGSLPERKQQVLPGVEPGALQNAAAAPFPHLGRGGQQAGFARVLQEIADLPFRLSVRGLLQAEAQPEGRVGRGGHRALPLPHGVRQFRNRRGLVRGRQPRQPPVVRAFERPGIRLGGRAHQVIQQRFDETRAAPPRPARAGSRSPAARAAPGMAAASFSKRSPSAPIRTGLQRGRASASNPGRNCSRATSAPVNRIAAAQYARSSPTITPGLSTCFPAQAASRSTVSAGASASAGIPNARQRRLPRRRFAQQRARRNRTASRGRQPQRQFLKPPQRDGHDFRDGLAHPVRRRGAFRHFAPQPQTAAVERRVKDDHLSP